MKAFAASILGILACACAAIDGSSLRPGVSTEADAKALMGPPAVEYSVADGTRRLMYPRGPLGLQTYVVAIDREGRVEDVRNALTDGRFNRIQPGMTERDILELIGPPGDTMRFSLSNTHAWDYRYMDTWGYTAIFSVTFDAEGRVVSKFTRRIERGVDKR